MRAAFIALVLVAVCLGLARGQFNVNVPTPSSGQSCSVWTNCAVYDCYQASCNSGTCTYAVSLAGSCTAGNPCYTGACIAGPLCQVSSVLNCNSTTPCLTTGYCVNPTTCGSTLLPTNSPQYLSGPCPTPPDDLCSLYHCNGAGSCASFGSACQSTPGSCTAVSCGGGTVGCVSANQTAGYSCSAGNPCTAGNDHCDAYGNCLLGAQNSVCDDHNDCTFDICNVTVNNTAVCSHTSICTDVKAWGVNAVGATGVITASTLPSPVDAIGLYPYSISGISAGVNHSLAASTLNVLFGSGLNTSGQLGALTPNAPFSQIPGLPPSGTTILSFSAGSAHSVVLYAAYPALSNALYVFGDSSYYQSGLGSTSPVLVPTLVTFNWSAFTTLPVLVSDIFTVSAGAYHTVALTSYYIWAWGSNSQNQCGFGSGITSASTPTQLPLLSYIYRAGTILDSWAGVSASVSGTLAWTTNGVLFAWGQNSYGELCKSGTIAKPTISSTFTSGAPKVVSATLSAQSSIILTKANAGSSTYSIYVCGNNPDGRLGITSLGAINPGPFYSPQLVSWSWTWPGTGPIPGASAGPTYSMYWYSNIIYYTGVVGTVASANTWTPYPYNSTTNVVTADAGSGYNLVVFSAH